jgi:hypothetical protein
VDMTQERPATAQREAPDIPGIMASLSARRPDASDGPAVASWMLAVLGVLHAPVYRARELRARLAADGIEAPMAAYLAQRSAPLGAPGPELVAATFYGFSPQVIAEHLPGVWERVAPQRVLELTLDAMRELLGRVLAGQEAVVAELARELAPVAAAHGTAGRPLAAAWSGVAATGEAPLDLWLATCVIRESRGDAHVALLVSEDIGPLESHLITQGDRPEQRPALRAMRGWTDDEIDEAARRLRQRELLDTDGRRTDRARALRSEIERRTDELSAGPWVSAGPDAVERIGDLALTLLPAVLASGTLLPPVIELLTRRR